MLTITIKGSLKETQFLHEHQFTQKKNSRKLTLLHKK